jgi:hypothetical protein
VDLDRCLFFVGTVGKDLAQHAPVADSSAPTASAPDRHCLPGCAPWRRV